MKDKKLIPIILVSASCILFIIAIMLVLNMNRFEYSNKTNNKDNSNNQIKEENKNNNVNNNKNDEPQDNKEEVKQPENNNSSNSSNPSTNNTQSNNNATQESKPENNIENNNPITKNESNVISYFESQDNIFTQNLSQDDSSFREKAKNAFVTVVDFIFYDKEIKGYTFKELTTTAKLKVIKLALSIDNKIDEYFPDYKDVIKDKYENIKGKLAVKYLEFTSTLCETVGADTCTQAKEDFNTMKESFGITWQLIKELASSGSTKVKEFYENWRDS